MLRNIPGAKRLQGETEVHDFDRVAHALGGGKVHEPALSEYMDRFSLENIGDDPIALDGRVRVFCQPRYIDLDVEVAGHWQGSHRV